MKRFAKLGAVAVSSVLMLTPLVACNGIGEGDGDISGWVGEDGKINVTEDVEIDFWGWGGQAEQDIYTAMCNVYMSLHPNFKINYTGYTSAQYLQNLTNASNDLPDIFYMPDTDFLQWVSDGVLWDFSDYVKKSDLDKAGVWEDGYDRYYYDTATKTLGYKECDTCGIYALPKDIGPFQFSYNETLLRQALPVGTSYEQVKETYLNEKNPMTWEKFIELGTLLKPYCTANNKYVVSHYELYAALYSNNADFVTDDGSASRIEEPQFAAALDFMHSLAFEHGLMAGSSGSSTTVGYSSFIGGNSIFSFLGAWDCATLWGTTSTSQNPISYDYKLLPVPYGPGADGEYGTADDGKSICQIGSMGYAISNNRTTSALQRAASLQFMQWLCYGEDAQRQLYKLGQQTPNIQEMAKGEYLQMQTVQSYKGTEVAVNPSNLEVYIDSVDGTSATDKVGGRMRTQVRTLGTEWKTAWSDAVTQYGFWTNADATGAGLVASYKSTLEGWLRQYNTQLGR